jgi:phosphotransferase system enzyme I (PtsP)
VLEAFHPRPVTLRTLDIGADKPLPYFPIFEPNPFLGWRGIRISLDHPEIFDTQLRALLRATQGHSNAKILLPMVSGVTELHQSLSHLEKVYQELTEEGRQLEKPAVGAMIELPSAVYQAELFARYVDFLSIGTNDLTQYMLAVDRDNERVAKLFDALHPAVLQAIYHVIRSGKQRGVPVTVCGEVAGDPAAALLLIGMGAESLSVNAGDIPKIKWLITKFSRSRARRLLLRALDMESGVVIREMLRGELEQAGLGALVRPGK